MNHQDVEGWTPLLGIAIRLQRSVEKDKTRSYTVLSKEGAQNPALDL